MPRPTANRNAIDPAQPPLILSPSAEEHLDVSTLEQWLWDAACEIRARDRCAEVQGFHPAPGLLQAPVGRLRRRVRRVRDAVRQRRGGGAP